MASRYDRRTTTFSPDGRLFQVEYAMEAIRNASACIGISYKDGILLVGEKNIKSKLWIPERSEKFAIIADHIVVSIAGITADANILVDDAQLNAARYEYKYQQAMPLEMCVHDTCNYTQYFTQFGGLRPFGVSMLWAGYNKKDGFQLFHSDPSGNYAEWQATAIGNNAKSAQSILKEDYKEDMSMDEAIDLCIKILTKTMDSPTLDAEQLELCTMKLEKDKPKYHQFDNKELAERIKKYQEAHKDEQAQD
eukprot:CAMPEP_0197075078 /NCGR_PEP_ID=MMETSP1384-20130603/211428_1 /TAXON_ID=29189 /ORGANISM="Ammonia sp." /LENGTH=249 /DNA_ID=CAMNT_0042513921 /DNA_START=1140 /DNA_END=1889 /DNA_ORIENTATION=+